ncbi:hypothetical protein FJT64_010485 [Amphibalanus amphitrite]|uniref:MBD domain-containing protein n=1 Tax=Amphibalanus amphitrite TaxID=1232801 RepID=A0A6A4VE64_AMPAM|nr:hypothetical protein FJT64_010485 [Amphibalanus amphitrite]
MSSSEDEVKEITLKGPLAEPFKHGWRREVVRRSTFNSGKNRHRFDCYYYMPNGKKLRSKREVEDALEALDDEDMDISNFSFAHQLVGVGPPHESMREAGANTTPVRSAALRNKRLKIAINQVAAEGAISRILDQSALLSGRGDSPDRPAAADRRRPKVVAKPPPPPKPLPVVMVRPLNGATQVQEEHPRPKFCIKALEGTLQSRYSVKRPAPPQPSEPPKRKLKLMVKGEPAQPVRRLTYAEALHALVGTIPGPGSVGTEPRLALSRLVDTRPWRLAVVAADGREAQTVDEPLRADPWRGVYVDQVRAQTPARLPPPYTLRIGRLRQYATCSLFCSRPGHPPPPVLPNLRCVGCFCLSHAACVGLPPPADPAHTDFLCMDCFDRLRRLSDEPAPAGTTSSGARRPSDPHVPPPGPPVRFSVRPSRLPSAPGSDPDVEEIVVVASEEESDVLLAAAAAEEEVQEVSDDDVLSCSSDDSPELDPSSPMSWSDGQEEVLLEDSDDASVKSSSPSPVLQSSPPALTRGPPRLTARTARPPPLTGPPPPLQRAPAGTKDIQKVVVVNRAPQTTGGQPSRARQPSGHGCKRTFTLKLNNSPGDGSQGTAVSPTAGSGPGQRWVLTAGDQSVPAGGKPAPNVVKMTVQCQPAKNGTVMVGRAVKSPPAVSTNGPSAAAGRSPASPDSQPSSAPEGKQAPPAASPAGGRRTARKSMSAARPQTSVSRPQTRKPSWRPSDE